MINPPKKAKRVLFYLLMVLITVLICFVILELGLATYYSEGQSASWSEFHPMRGWALIPGEYKIKPLQRLSRFPISINNYGLRSHTLPKSSGKRKQLLVLGDSFTFAKETRTEKMFTQRLQVLLEKRSPGIYEVLNAGVPAYGTGQQLLLMRELHEKHNIAPGLYVLMFFTNDILDNLCLSYGNLTPQSVRPGFIVTDDHQVVLERLPENRLEEEADDTLQRGKPRRTIKSFAVIKALMEEWLQPRPKLVRFLGRLGIKPRVARMPALLNGWYQEDVVFRGVDLTAALIRQMSTEVRQRGGLLLVSMVPSPLQVYPETYIPLLRRSFPDNPRVSRFIEDVRRPQDLVKRICDEAGIPFQDLLPIFIKNNRRTLFIPKDGHLNDAGHRLAATSLYDFLDPRLTERPFP